MTNITLTGLAVVGVVNGTFAGESVGVTTTVVLTTGREGTVVGINVCGVPRGKGVTSSAVTWVGVPRETATFWLGFAGFWATTENDCAAVSREVLNAIVARPF
jgi:hypothetical protein